MCEQICSEASIPEEWTKPIVVAIQKKGDLSECKNYRNIALISYMGKIMLLILLNRLKAQVESILADAQAGF